MTKWACSSPWGWRSWKLDTCSLLVLRLRVCRWLVFQFHLYTRGRRWRHSMVDCLQTYLHFPFYHVPLVEHRTPSLAMAYSECTTYIVQQVSSRQRHSILQPRPAMLPAPSTRLPIDWWRRPVTTPRGSILISPPST